MNSLNSLQTTCPHDLRADSQDTKLFINDYNLESDWDNSICQWAATDSPAGSGWRPNSPIGLWDLDYYRKHTYAGFADGLK